MNSQIFQHPDSAIPAIQDALLSWFARHARPLPWRQDYTPYRVWISEVMLQQTQMDRGVKYFLRWMERFPDVQALAAAPEEDVLSAWEGLGYYSRARNVRKAAQYVAGPLKGVFPSEPEAILELPGVGPYTAAAVASIAFNKDIACIDANVERVISRLWDIDQPVKKSPAKERIKELAEQLLPKGKARYHNQAMMELGALVCGRGPDCPACPLSGFCLAYKNGTADDRPVREEKGGMIPVSAATGVLLHKGKVFIQKRLPNDTWGGMWEFPGGSIEAGETPDQTVVREFFEETGFQVRIVASLGIQHATFTRHALTLHCYLLAFINDDPDSPLPPPPVLTAATEWCWAGPKRLASVAMPSAHRKLADSLDKPRKNRLPGI